MRLNFRKVSAIAASALMVGMTMGVAAAATYYPQPFVSGSGSDVAVIYGTGDGVSTLDLVQAGNIQANLQSNLGGSSGGATGSINGEAAPLFSDGTKIYIADSLSKVKSILTESDLPVLLADGSFSGNVDSTYTQTIVIGSYSNITYAKQPTSSDDPNLAIQIGSSATNYAYNMTVTFNKVINFSSADSEGEEVSLFGIDYTVGADTDGTNLVLLQSAEKVSLSSDGPTADVTVGGKEYTIELVSASDTTASIKVTDKATGASEQKEVTEASSKKIKGISVAVTTADENNLKYSASLVAGTEKVTLTSGDNVKIGETGSAVLGTQVDFGGGTPGAGLSKITISVFADESDTDAIKTGGALLDPVFKAVKLTLAGFNIEETSASREDIKVEASGDSKMQVSFTDYDGNTLTQRYALYSSSAGVSNSSLYVDDDRRNMSVAEGERLHKDDYVVLGNEDEGHLLRVSSVRRGADGGTTASNDYLKFIDVLSNKEISATLTANTSARSTGTIDVGGKRYDVILEGMTGIDSTLYNVTINYPDSSGNTVILYPTIETSMGAKLAFYEPVTIPLLTWWNVTGSMLNVSGILVPNGADTYQTMAIPVFNASFVNVTCSGTTTELSSPVGAISNSTTCTIANTGFRYNISFSAQNTIQVKLQDALGTTPIADPAIMIFEEKDDNNNYEGLIVTTEDGATSDDGVGVNDVQRTWTDDLLWDEISMASDSKKLKEIDLFGTLITIDNSDSDQKKATISYPDEQIYALVYVAANAATVGVSGGSSAGAQLGDVLVKDTEVSSVSSKNLIVVGGSCINSVAANLLGGLKCGADFTSATDVGSGQFLIQSFASPYSSTKVALLVAGYEATETGWASTYLRTQNVETTAGKKYKGTSATSAELVTTSV
jgi:hypothetical protein